VASFSDNSEIRADAPRPRRSAAAAWGIAVRAARSFLALPQRLLFRRSS
jgi:hypothetical protein